jgi:hypothetical protein
MTRDEEKAVKRKVRILKYADEIGYFQDLSIFLDTAFNILCMANAFRISGERRLALQEAS